MTFSKDGQLVHIFVGVKFKKKKKNPAGHWQDSTYANSFRSAQSAKKSS